jgi:tetratricopeptide (TPR) repeat protein
MVTMRHRRKVLDEIARWVDELRLSDASDDEIIRAIEGRIETEADLTTVDVLKRALAREHSEQGNEAAADMLYRELDREVDYWYRNLHRTHPRAHDKIIKAIEDRIGSNPKADEVDDLYRMLAEEYSFHGNYAAAEAIHRRLADKHPDDPLPLISLASNKLSLQDQPEEAMELINRALEVAYRTGEHRRFALGDKARIALKLQNYNIVEAVLKEIMQLKIDPEVPDIGRERDFFDRLPPGGIDSDVARQYDEYCRAVGLQPRKRQSADLRNVWCRHAWLHTAIGSVWRQPFFRH